MSWLRRRSRSGWRRTRRVEFRDESHVASTGQIGLDALLQAGQVLLGESRLLDPREWLVELCEGLAAPEIERSTERGGSFVGVTVRKRLAAICVELLEAAQIERMPVEVDDVAGRTRAEQPVRQLLAQLGDEDLDHLLRASPAPRRPRGRRRADPSGRRGRREEAAAPATPSACLPSA